MCEIKVLNNKRISETDDKKKREYQKPAQKKEIPLILSFPFIGMMTTSTTEPGFHTQTTKRYL